jgi:Tol biopolymer transport system component
VRYDVSDEGTLVFLPGGQLERESAWFWVDPDDPSEPVEIPATRRAGNHVAMSPQGDRFVYTRWEGGWNIAYVYDLRRGIERAISHPEANAWGPYWFPDGERLAFGQGGAGVAGVTLHWAWADGRSLPEPVEVPGDNQTVNQVTPEGTVVFKQTTPEVQRDIVEVDPSSGEANVLVGGPADQTHGALSPDRSWIAYASSETGRWEVYVRRLHPDSVPQQVSVSGGLAPLWSRGGERLYFRSLDGDTIWVADPPDPTVGREFSFPTVALAGDFGNEGAIHQRGYDLGPDGRFLVRIPLGDFPPIRELRVVVGWDVGLAESVSGSGGG